MTPTGDLILETRAWRERLFAARGAARRCGRPASSSTSTSFMLPPGMGGRRRLALNQLLVVMDGIGDPPFKKRLLTNKFNLYLDALFILPRRIGGRSLRVRPPKPTSEQIFFVGACNVPIEVLDPALTRPGRIGRHVWFRTPTKQDRLDIFNLYIDKVAHEPDLDTPQRRDELARITNGYSPAMIEQVCSMALTVAHYDGRERFGWRDIVDAMTTDRVGHRGQHRVRPRGDARRGDPRGRARRRRARVHEGRRVDAPLDPRPRPLARATIRRSRRRSASSRGGTRRWAA